MRVLLGRGAKTRHTGQVSRSVVASASNEGYPKVLNHVKLGPQRNYHKGRQL